MLAIEARGYTSGSTISYFNLMGQLKALTLNLRLGSNRLPMTNTNKYKLERFSLHTVFSLV